MTSKILSSSPLAITPGEPAGIGPDLCVQLANSSAINNSTFNTPYVVVADPDLLLARAKSLGLPLSIQEYDDQQYDHQQPSKTGQGILTVLPVPLSSPVTPGQLDTKNSAYVLKTLDLAIEGCQNKRFSGLVTGPVHKGIINDAGIGFSGHTEYLQEHTQTETVVMMLATQGLRVALTTTHLPLSEVPSAITQELLTRIIQVLNNDLQSKFNIKAPRILVCGLNPHAGENGHLGREEIDTIIPVLDTCRLSGINLKGPLPADTLFTEKNLNEADAVLAMYHDQGLPVLKYKGFGQAVNITLGLPFIRTSVDHGTALDLAGTGKADCGSLFTALKYAEEMIRASL